MIITKIWSEYVDDVMEITKDQNDFERQIYYVDRIKLLREIVEYRIKSSPDRLYERKIELRNATTAIDEATRDIQSMIIRKNFFLFLINFLL